MSHNPFSVTARWRRAISYLPEKSGLQFTLCAAVMISLGILGAGCAGGASPEEPPLGAPAEPRPELTDLAPGEEPSLPTPLSAPTQPAPPGTATPPPDPGDGLQGAQGEPTITAEEPVALMPENRLLAFEWPAQIRVGDSDLLRLTLLVDSQGNITPSAVFQEHEIQAQPLIVENLYDTHQIRAEARLDMAGLQVEPPGTTIQRLFPGEPVTFSWSVSPPTQGTYRGNVWLFLRYIPFEEGEPDTEKLIYSQPVEIQTVNLLGLGGRPARILGAIGSAIGSLLGLDDLISWLRRARRRASRR